MWVNPNVRFVVTDRGDRPIDAVSNAAAWAVIHAAVAPVVVAQEAVDRAIAFADRVLPWRL